MNSHLAYKQKRLSLGMSLDDASQKTKIRISYLKAIEEGDFTQLPDPFFAKSYIRDYALFLTISPEPLILQYDRFLNSLKAKTSDSLDDIRMPDKPSDAEIAELIAYETNFPKKKFIKFVLLFVVTALMILATVALKIYFSMLSQEAKTEAKNEEIHTTRPSNNLIITVDANMATLRIDPNVDAEPVTWAAKGVTFMVKDVFIEEQTGKKWYKVTTSTGKDCWIADKVVTISNKS